MKKHNATKTVLLIFLFLSTVSAANAASFVIGRIYLKNGSVIECTENDRIKLPKRSGKTVFLRNAYRKEEVRERSASSSRQKASAGCGYMSRHHRSASGFIPPKATA